MRLGGPLTKRGDAGVNGKPAVILSIQKQPNADTVSLTRAIEREIANVKLTLPQVDHGAHRDLSPERLH